MKFAPYAVACLLFNNTARFGFDLLQALGWFVVTVLLGLSLHMFGVYSLSVYFLSRISPIEFFQTHKDGDPDGVFDVVVECDAADSAASVRTKPRRAAGD